MASMVRTRPATATVVFEWKLWGHSPGAQRPEPLHTQQGTLQRAQTQDIVRAERFGC